MVDALKLANILMKSMVAEHRQLLEKQGNLAVAAYMSAMEGEQQHS
jgi:hypothetical protein